MRVVGSCRKVGMHIGALWLAFLELVDFRIEPTYLQGPSNLRTRSYFAMSVDAQEQLIGGRALMIAETRRRTIKTIYT